MVMVEKWLLRVEKWWSWWIHSGGEVISSIATNTSFWGILGYRGISSRGSNLRAFGVPLWWKISYPCPALGELGYKFGTTVVRKAGHYMTNWKTQTLEFQVGYERVLLKGRRGKDFGCD